MSDVGSAERVGRFLALGLGLVAVVVRLGFQFVVTPLVWDWRVWGSLLVYGGPFVVLLVLMGVFSWVMKRLDPRVPPAGFQIAVMTGRPVFQVSASARATGPLAMLWMCLGALALTDRTPEGAVYVPPYGWPPTVLAMTLSVTAAVWLLFRPPVCVLTPNGLILRGVRTRIVAWSLLLPGGPAHPRPGESSLMLLWQGPELPVGMRRYFVPLRWLFIDPSFLADAIYWYVEHPEDRARIGTATEHARLRRALAVRV